MGSVVIDMSMSLDGYIAAPNDNPEQGLGEDGMRLHNWAFDDPSVFERVYGKLVEETGAVIMGRRSYDNSIEAWGGKGPLGDVPYLWSERKQESWTARQLPASHTTTSTVKLISKGGAQNAFITTTYTTTIDADGVPSVTEDGVSVDCRG